MDICHLFIMTYCVDHNGKCSGKNISSRHLIGPSLIKFFPALAAETWVCVEDREAERDEEETRSRARGSGPHMAPAESWA